MPGTSRTALGHAQGADLAREPPGERVARAAQGGAETPGLPQNLIDQLPTIRPERPTVVSTTGRIEQRLTVTPLRQVPNTPEAMEGQVRSGSYIADPSAEKPPPHY